MKLSFDEDSGFVSSKKQKKRSEENILMADSRFMCSETQQSGFWSETSYYM